MATERTATITLKIKLLRLCGRPKAKGLCSMKTISAGGWDSSQGSKVACLIETSKLLQSRSVALQKMKVSFGANEVKVPLQSLAGHMFEVEGKVGPNMDVKLFIDVGSVLSKRGAEEPNRSLGMMGLLRPSLSASMRGWGGKVLLSRKMQSRDSTSEADVCIGGNAGLDSVCNSRMLGKDASEELPSPKKDLKARFKGSSFSTNQVVSEYIAARMTVKTNSLSNRDREACK